jgi:sugar O-acyltransferase (sialic acid O-acetyltransferase NeuD family)
MKKKVVIIGAGGFGREVLDIFEADNEANNKWEVRGFIDDNPQLLGQMIRGYKVLGGLAFLSKLKNKQTRAIIAVGDTLARKKIAEKVKALGAKFCNIIHPSVIKTPHVEFGEGVIVTAGCIFTNNIKIGNHVIINLNATIGHDTIIEDFVTLSPGVHINGRNRISEGVYVGSGAVTIQDVSLGKWSTIGAGAVVVKDIPERVVAVGIPAKPIKQIEGTK